MDRNRLIAGAAIAIVLLILLVYGLTQWPREQPRASQRSPLAKLAYCSSDDVRPCIVSFSLDADGNMLVNILTPGTPFPVFYLKIIHEKGESIYECQRAEGFPEHVYCIGEKMETGKILQFLIISRRNETILAEGNFAIIGLALATPEIALPTPTIDLTVSPTSDPLRTPTPIRTPSYPNPSPSYP